MEDNDILVAIVIAALVTLAVAGAAAIIVALF